MNTLKLSAHAKINLALDVINKRPDGYHNMDMVMQPLHLHDSLYFKKERESGVRLTCNYTWLPTDGRNLIVKAAQLLLEQYAPKAGVSIHLTKRIPVCAGLGGGSADCAATLIGLRRLFKLSVSDRTLYHLGRSLGADVPFCLLSQTAQATGIGEVLTPLPTHPVTIVLLAKPGVRVSTGDVFGRLDLNQVHQRPDIDGMIGALAKGNMPGVSALFCNVLETVTAVQYPVIETLKGHMMAAGAMGAVMSGSGPTVFGYFKTKEQAMAAITTIRQEEPSCRDIILTSTYNPTTGLKPLTKPL